MEAILGSAGATFLESLNWVDTLVIVIVLASATAGFLSGFIWQILRIASLLAAFAVATRFHSGLGRYLSVDIPEATRWMICYLALLVGVLVVAYAILFLARGPINSLKVEVPDRIIGAILGVGKGVLICGIISLIVLKYTPTGTALEEAVRNSPLSQYCSEATRSLWGLMPGAGL